MIIRVLLFCLFLIGFSACSPHEIRFFREGAFSDFELYLYNDTTFYHTSQAQPPMFFDERGTWHFQDSLLILDYTNESYSIDCSVFSLQNDTFLIGVYFDQIFLYPIRTIHNSQRYSYDEMMESLLRLYNHNSLQKSIGIDFYSIPKHHFEFFFGKRTYMISKYYDTYIETNNFQN